MLSESALLEWLRVQPFDAPVIIDGETVLLKRHAAGAELIAYLVQGATQQQVMRAMEQGFANALEFDAGLGLAPDGNSLLLTQWLPHVSTWTEAARPLEHLLNQLTNWRTALAPPETVRVTTKTITNRNEQRLRMMFAGENS